MFDPVEELEDAVEKLAAAEAPADVLRLTQVIERLEFQRLRAIAHLDRTASYVDDGALTAASWLRHRCRMPHGVATASVHLARRLPDLPVTSEAFEEGAITRRHAQVIADACTPAHEQAIRALEPDVVDTARHASVHELRSLLAYIVDALEGDGGAASANAQYERRRLHVSRLLDGMIAIDGLLDGESGETVLTALNAAMEAPHVGETRAPAQRRADALVNLCQAAMSQLVAGPGRARRPHLDVTVDLEVLERRGGVALAHRVRSDAAHFGYLPPETLRRISCDATIARVITNGTSQPLDVGRTTRIVPNALWRALVARDRGCVAPGCDRPPGWCDAHHRTHWADGGETNLANCELRCRRHHRAVHEHARDERPP